MENNIWRLRLERLFPGENFDEVLQNLVRGPDCPECSDHHVCPDCVISFLTVQQGNGQNDGTDEPADDQVDLNPGHKINKVMSHNNQKSIQNDEEFDQLAIPGSQENMHHTRQIKNLSNEQERNLDSRSSRQKLAQNPVIANGNSSSAHQELRPKLTLSFIPSLQPERFAQINNVEELNSVLDFLDPSVLRGFLRRKKMLQYYAVFVPLIVMVVDHNRRNPRNHFALIHFAYNEEVFFFKKDDCKKYLYFVATGNHFTVIYFDIDSKIVMYADSLHSFDFGKQKIEKIAERIKMSEYEILKLGKSRIEHQPKTNSCGIHTIANSFMFLKYGTGIPLFHVKTYKIRDQVAIFIWHCFEKHHGAKMTEENIFGYYLKGSEYEMNFAPESSDEDDVEEEIDPKRGEPETFESKIIKLIYPAPENDFTDSEAASTAFSRASSRSVSSFSHRKKTNRRKQIPVPRTVEPEVIDISDDELPVQHLKNRRSNENGSRTIEVITLSDDESSSSVSSEIFGSLAIETVPSVKINVASNSVASTKLDITTAAANGSNTEDQLNTHSSLNACFGVTAALESMEVRDTETSKNGGTTAEDFEKDSEEVIVLDQATNDTHDTVFVHQNQGKKDLSINDLIGHIEEQALKKMIVDEQISEATNSVLPRLFQDGDVPGIINSQNNFDPNGTDGSGAIDQPEQVHELEANEHLFYRSKDSDYEKSKEIPVENQDMIETSFDQLRTELASPNVEDQMDIDTDHLNESNIENDKNSSRYNEKISVAKQKDESEIHQSPSVTDQSKTRTSNTVLDPIHRPDSSNSKKSARAHPPGRLHKIRSQPSTRRSKGVQQAPKRPRNDEPPSSSDSSASSNKKTKVTWGLYTKGERNDERLTRQKTTAIRNELGKSTDLTGNTDPFNGVDWKVLKKKVLAAVQPKEVVWKNAQGHKLKQAWEEIGVEVMSKHLTYEELRPLRQILENTKNCLRREIRKLVSKEVAPEEMEHHLQQWEGYEDCKFLRETLKDQEAECRLRHEEEKKKEQRKKERMAEKKEKKPKKK